jgi:hypothetical protein
MSNDNNTGTLVNVAAPPLAAVAGVSAASFNLAEHATLIRVKITAWSAHSKCDKAAEAAARVGGAKRDRIKSIIKHVEDPDRKEINDVVNEARNWYAKETHAWDDGTRLVTNVQYERVNAQLLEYRAKFWEAVQKFLKRLPEFEAKAAPDQGDYAGLFPTAAEVEKRFGFEITRSAVPRTDDIRLKHVSPEAAQQIERETKEMQAKLVTECMTDVVARINAVLGAFITNMRKADELGTKAGWHETTIENVVELGKLIPELNLTGDRALNAAARAMVEQFRDYDKDTLKKDSKEREAATVKATNLLDAVRNMKITDGI